MILITNSKIKEENYKVFHLFNFKVFLLCFYFCQLGGPAQVEGKNEKKKEDAGISWGMSDEQEVYDYFDENQIALIPDLLRRLPNLTEKQVEKIDKYEERLAKYNA